MTVLEKLLQLAEINLWMFQYGLHTGLLFIFICNDYEIFILFHEWDSLCGSQKSRVTAEPTEPSQPPITKTSTAPGIVTSPGAYSVTRCGGISSLPERNTRSVYAHLHSSPARVNKRYRETKSAQIIGFQGQVRSQFIKWPTAFWLYVFFSFFKPPFTTISSHLMKEIQPYYHDSWIAVQGCPD